MWYACGATYVVCFNAREDLQRCTCRVTATNASTTWLTCSTMNNKLIVWVRQHMGSHSDELWSCILVCRCVKSANRERLYLNAKTIEWKWGLQVKVKQRNSTILQVRLCWWHTNVCHLKQKNGIRRMSKPAVHILYVNVCGSNIVCA
jgi:hypothetical protein